MGSRTITLRRQVAFLVTALVLLWAFAAWMTLRDGANMLGVNELNAKVYEPSEPLIAALQQERRASVVYLGSAVRDRRALEETREATDSAVASFVEQSQRWQARLAGSDESDKLIQDTVARLEQLGDTRKPVDDTVVDRATAIAGYTEVIDSIFQVWRSLGQLDDEHIANTTANLIDLKRAWEVMSQQDALVTGALTAGRISPAEHAEFTKLVGTYRFLIQDTGPRLSGDDQVALRQLTTGDVFERLRRYEDQVVEAGPTGAPRLTIADWQETSQAARDAVNDLILARGDALVAAAVPVVVGIVLRLLFATGLGALMVWASLLASRHLVRRMDRLRRDAGELATDKLPTVIERLSRGEHVDVRAEAPDLDYGRDEFGQVGLAFNDVQHTAIRAAVEQAELRRDVNSMFLNISRRTQGLVHRQLTVLTEMQRQEDDAATLERLFDIDHLATRMRRNAENLIVLTGATSPRTWKRDIPILDVVRGAVAEVEDYTRVSVLPMADAGLAGRAVADATHLLAELIENGLSFSPPTTPVHVTGQAVANGYAVEVEDRGLGMDPEGLAAANARLASPDGFRLSDNPQLGLFVVARLAARLGARVHLKESAYGGTTAVVLFPSDLVTDSPTTNTNAGLRGPQADTQALAIVGARQPAADSGQAPAQPSTAVVATQQTPATVVSEPTPTAPDGVADGVTDTGLPQRVRRAPQAVEATALPATPTPERDPEAVRQKISAFQDGTRRGRAAGADNDQDGDGTSTPVGS
ncbi:nitrate- and nitrite sensing domain-containing protein [Micromonospora endolithica]|uniref:histidine kinase n=1 Tax=Micromonospora endolithica TaxID=230091 RepID=A0A3A9ZR00_9ACTN|nr:nitrate- and nitrite sensing domain-containing protein [Micromonospora endolithica]RKN50625.1 HAMP domain-containing protein [Micromonospora endolithica]TWJ20649.1 signal transduction histidine kinase [Micromonospora endolithica]